MLGRLRCVAAPFRLSARPSRQEAGPPYGADNDSVFGELIGVGADARGRLAREGVFE